MWCICSDTENEYNNVACPHPIDPNVLKLAAVQEHLQSSTEWTKLKHFTSAAKHKNSVYFSFHKFNMTARAIL